MDADDFLVFHQVLKCPCKSHSLETLLHQPGRETLHLWRPQVTMKSINKKIFHGDFFCFPNRSSLWIPCCFSCLAAEARALQVEELSELHARRDEAPWSPATFWTGWNLESEVTLPEMKPGNEKTMNLEWRWFSRLKMGIFRIFQPAMLVYQRVFVGKPN